MKTAYILDYGCGNVKSLGNFFRRQGLKCEITNQSESIVSGDLLVLPGVGSFGAAMNNMTNLGTLEALQRRINLDKPTLGICLGFQLLTNGSEEAQNRSGIKFFNTQTIKMSEGPEIGWKHVENIPKIHNISSMYFFNHSYGVIKNDDQIESSFVSNSQYLAYARNSMVIGVQFHPEKSQKSGQNFVTTVMQKTWGL